MLDTTGEVDCYLKQNKRRNEDSVCLKSLRLSINLLTNVLMFLIVFLCLLHACSSESIGVFHLHIILCVLGYHFLMCQGTLIMSNYNSWSMFIPRRLRRTIHSVLQFLAAVLVMSGSILIICMKSEHFNTMHGTLGICALIATVISVLNGLLSMHAYKRVSYTNLYWIKFIHYTAGTLTTFLATASLCGAFQMTSFRLWAGHRDIISVLIFLTWLYTFLVAVEYWILLINKLRNLIL